MTPRIYVPISLQASDIISLPAEAAHHISKVLRRSTGDCLILFNGSGGEYRSQIDAIHKKEVRVKLIEFNDISREPELAIHLCHGLVRGDKMDWIIQKATEMGVKYFTPIQSEKSQVRLNTERLAKKRAHWEKIIISSSEQCGRNTLMQLNPVCGLDDILKTIIIGQAFVCHPSHGDIQPSMTLTETTLFIGPESGWSHKEHQNLVQNNVLSLSLGERILRTETAATVAITHLYSQLKAF